mmetsp:Transcript_27363/g.63128  ORF Transcript_27363/g.63128 Transcript_27363/m.63128 type:complete len:221 (-) Transcript_27363:4461-5123(-)
MWKPLLRRLMRLQTPLLMKHDADRSFKRRGGFSKSLRPSARCRTLWRIKWLRSGSRCPWVDGNWRCKNNCKQKRARGKWNLCREKLRTCESQRARREASWLQCRVQSRIGTPRKRGSPENWRRQQEHCSDSCRWPARIAGDLRTWSNSSLKPGKERKNFAHNCWPQTRQEQNQQPLLTSCLRALSYVKWTETTAGLNATISTTAAGGYILRRRHMCLWAY